VIVMLSTAFKQQRYTRAVQLLADCSEKPPTLKHTDSEQHTSTSSKTRSSTGSEQHTRTSSKSRSTTDSEQHTSTSSRTRSTTSPRSQKDSARGHSRGLSKGKRNKALLFQRATELLGATGSDTATLDPTKGKEKHASASQSRDPQKGDEPERHIVSL